MSSDPLTAEDSSSQYASKCRKTQKVTANSPGNSRVSADSANVPSEDKPDTIEERSSDKLDNKLSDKSEAEVAQIVAIWPQLPEYIKAASVALVKMA